MRSVEQPQCKEKNRRADPSKRVDEWIIRKAGDLGDNIGEWNDSVGHDHERQDHPIGPIALAARIGSFQERIW